MKQGPNGRGSRASWHSELFGVIVIGLIIVVMTFAMVDIWVSAGGDLRSDVDLGGRWGEGTVGSAIFAFGLIIVLLTAYAQYSIRSLKRGWPPARSRRR